MSELVHNRSEIYTLQNAAGVKMTVTPLGGKVMSLWVPDRNGVLGDVVLGYDRIEDFQNGNPYFGAIVGRYANRIKAGRFAIAGEYYQLTRNNGNNTLHGGGRGLHQVWWKCQQLSASFLELTYFSPHLEENFPGNVEIIVTYQLTDDHEWVIDYRATTDRPTILNLTHHAFFNLAGEGVGDVLNHEVRIAADRFCAVDDELIPTGDLADVTNTPFDFRIEKSLWVDIDSPHRQIQYGHGFDHTWVLSKNSNELGLAATVYEPSTGRQMEVFTTEPGLQFYSGNFLDGSDVGKGGKRYGYRSALCLEAQHFPDSPNQSHFPTTLLHPGETYRQRTVYRFSVR